MKKILCLILALCCVFSMASCFGEKEDENPDKAFFDAVASSNSTQIKTLTYYTVEGEEPYNGTFETVIEDNGDFRFTYSFMRAATLDDYDDPTVEIKYINNKPVAVVPGVVYYEGGKYSTDGETWFSEAPAVITNQPKLNIDQTKLGEYVMNETKTELTATLTSEAAKEVLGMTIEADSDIVITINTNGTYLTRVCVSYQKGAAKVKIDTSYS